MSRLVNTIAGGLLAVGSLNACSSETAPEVASPINSPSPEVILHDVNQVLSPGINHQDISHMDSVAKVIVGNANVFIYGMDDATSPVNAKQLVKTAAAITELTLNDPVQQTKGTIEGTEPAVSIDFRIITAPRKVTNSYLIVGNDQKSLGVFAAINKTSGFAASTFFVMEDIPAPTVGSIDLSAQNSNVDGSKVKAVEQAETTELCQAGIRVDASVISANHGGIPMTQPDFDAFNNDPQTDILMQELVCNSISRAISFARTGESYEDYVASASARPLEIAQHRGLIVDYKIYDEATYARLTALFKA